MTATSSERLRYSWHSLDPVLHRFGVSIEWAECVVPTALAWNVWMPVWTPGSYLVREFSRHIYDLRAKISSAEVDVPLRVTKDAKNRWRICLSEQDQSTLEGIDSFTLHISYEVYGFDPSVRASYFDQERLAFDGAAVWLSIDGTETLPRQIALPDYKEGWRWETALDPVTLNDLGAGVYAAHDYWHHVDNPVLGGMNLQVASAVIAGVPHSFVFDDALALDLMRLQRDMVQICEWHAAFWEGLPFKRYKTLTQVQASGFGGLEHAESTRLLAGRRDLPRPDRAVKPDDYITFLGLFSHEYFHSWWVKRLRPSSLVPYQFEQENYTELLWMFEGFTSYFDDLSLVQMGQVSTQQYFKIMARLLDRVRNTPAHHHYTLAESSFDAWIRYYRPDENTPNATVSYYDHGAVLALVIDVMLLKEGSSLAQILVALWKKMRDAELSVMAVTEAQFIALLCEHAPNIDWADFIRINVHTPCLPNYESALKELGVCLEWHHSQTAAAMSQALGVQFKSGTLEVAKVLRDYPAAQAGVHVGDTWLALEEEALSPSDWHEHWAAFDHRQSPLLTLHFFREKRLCSTEIISPAPYASHQLRWEVSAQPQHRQLAARWLNRSSL